MAQKAEIRSNLPLKIQISLQNFWGMSLVFLVLILLIRILELKLVFDNHVLNFTFWDVLTYSILEDLEWFFYFVGLLLFIHAILSMLSVSLAKWWSQLVFAIALIIQTALIFYFVKTLLPLGQDLFAYSREDLILTLEASGQLNTQNMILGLLAFLVLFLLLQSGIWLFKFSLKSYFILTLLLYSGLLVINFFPFEPEIRANEAQLNVRSNKSRFLAFQTFDYFMYTNEYYFDFYLRSSNDDLVVQKDYYDNAYPFAFKAEYPDVLGPYFDSLQKKPDIVFILIESIGKAYSGQNAYLGSFTPFLDSLEQHSLVWLNNISSTGRTFGILPGIFSGLPFGESGFLELYQNFPKHETLLSVLKKNDYEVRYFIGADRNFDHQGPFLEYQQVDQLVDILGFDPKYQKAPSNSGFSWGYSDKELFRNALEKLPETSEKPQLRIFQTQTSHDPYLVPQRELYQTKLRNHLTDYLNLNPQEVTDYLSYEDIYMTILYADDAIKEFITEYKKRPEFENTIFVITGDHRLPEIPMSSRLDRFHVPLIIYSPLLKRTAYFKGMSSHFEVTPSLLAFLRENTAVEVPEIAAWQGQVLDTARQFQARLSMPLMRNKNQLLEYVDGEFLLSDGQLFLISDQLNIDPISDGDMQNRLTGLFNDFKNKNSYMVQTRKLLP